MPTKLIIKSFNSLDRQLVTNYCAGYVSLDIVTKINEVVCFWASCSFLYCFKIEY